MPGQEKHKQQGRQQRRDTGQVHYSTATSGARQGVFAPAPSPALSGLSRAIQGHSGPSRAAPAAQLPWTPSQPPARPISTSAPAPTTNRHMPLILVLCSRLVSSPVLHLLFCFHPPPSPLPRGNPLKSALVPSSLLQTHTGSRVHHNFNICLEAPLPASIDRNKGHQQHTVTPQPTPRSPRRLPRLQALAPVPQLFLHHLLSACSKPDRPAVFDNAPSQGTCHAQVRHPSYSSSAPHTHDRCPWTTMDLTSANMSYASSYTRRSCSDQKQNDQDSQKLLSPAAAASASGNDSQDAPLRQRRPTSQLASGRRKSIVNHFMEGEEALLLKVRCYSTPWQSSGRTFTNLLGYLDGPVSDRA